MQTNEIAAGRVRILVNVPGTPEVSGSGYLCQIRFHAVGAAGASSDIDLENGSLSDKNGNAIPANWTGTTVNIVVLTIAVLAPWIGLIAAIIAGATITWRRRRAQS